MNRSAALVSALMLAGATAGCGGGTAGGSASTSPVESATTAPRTGAQEANASDCIKQDKAKQQACMAVTADVMQFTSYGGLEPVTWDYVSTTIGCNNTHKSYWHDDPAPPASFTTSANFTYWTTSLTDDICPNVNYKTDGSQLPDQAQNITFYAIDQNVGENRADCTPDQPYTYCSHGAPGSGNLEDFTYNMRNFPVTVAIQNSLAESVTLKSKQTSAMTLDSKYGTADNTIAGGRSSQWGAYRQHSTTSTMSLAYTVGGDQEYSGTVFTITVQVDQNGSPAGSKCSVANKSQFNSVFCSVSTSPVIPTPSEGGQTIKPSQQPPVTIAVQVHE